MSFVLATSFLLSLFSISVVAQFSPEALLQPRRLSTSYSKRAVLERSMIGTKAKKGNPSVGWYEVRQYVEEGTCDGSYITEFYEYGNCQVDMNNEYSRLAISGPTDGAFMFNRTFFTDDLCEDTTGDYEYFSLPSECQATTGTDDADTQYGIAVMGVSSKLNIKKKTMGYTSWNTVEQCDADKLSDANYMLVTNFKSCYPNTNANLTYEGDDFYSGDDNMTMYKSFRMKSCKKVEYFEEESCTGNSVTLKKTFSFDDDASVCKADDGMETDVEMYSTYYCKGKKSKKNICFAGSESVLMESGVRKLVSEVAIGDRVQVYSADTSSMGFSEVIAIPHASNNDVATFVQISTASGDRVKMSPDHLVASGVCSMEKSTMLPLVRAADVEEGNCVHTTQGQSMVTRVDMVEEEGIYTFVTRAEFVVVGNVVASPFAVNHKILHFFYNLHRALPVDSPLVHVFHAVADQISNIAVLPGIRSLFAVSA